MHDRRTPEEKREAWYRAAGIAHSQGWRNAYGWVFRAPGGTLHDLSAADLTRLDYIEQNGSFLVVPEQEADDA